MNYFAIWHLTVKQWTMAVQLFTLAKPRTRADIFHVIWSVVKQSDKISLNIVYYLHFSSVKGPNFALFCRYLTQRFIFPNSAIESNLVITDSSHVKNPLVSPSSTSPVYSHARLDVFTRASFLSHLWSLVIYSTRIKQAVKDF